MVPRRLGFVVVAVFFLGCAVLPAHAQKSKSAGKNKAEAHPPKPAYLSAQDKIKLPSGQEISVAEIVPRSDEALKQLQQIATAVKPPSLETASTALSTLDQKVKDTKADADNAIQMAHSNLQITEFRVQWNRYRSQLDGIKSTITTYANSLDDNQKQLAALKETWSFLAGPQFARKLDPDLVHRIAIVADVIQGLEKDIASQSEVLVKLQVLLAETGSQIDDTLEQLSLAETALREQLFVIDSPPLLTALGSADYGGSLRQMVSLAVSSGSRLDHFYSAYRSNLVLFLLLSIGLWVAVARLAKTDVPGVPAGTDPHILACLKHPLALSALLALFLCSAIFPKAPLDFLRLCRLLAVLPATHLALSMAQRKLHPYIAGIALTFAINMFSAQISAGTIFRRLTCLILTVVLAAAIVRLLRQGGLLRVLFEERQWVVPPMLLGIGVFLLVISILSEIIGNTSLADLLTNGTVFSIYYSLAIFVFVAALMALTAAFTASAIGRRSRAVRLHSDLINHRVFSYLKVGGWILWIVVLLVGFQISHEAFGSASDLLHQKWQLGAISISLLDIVLFCLVLAASTQIAKLIRFLLNEEILPRTSINTGVAQAGTRLTYIALLSVGLFLALGAAGLELSKLTVLTGAFGVGLGFGLQNVVNNFVSGVILSLERPVQIGDMVELNNVSGEVTVIGFRSSTIRTFEGADVIVPNSELITKSVINWSLTDYLRRTDIQVGVAYGTDPDKVIALLTQITNSHPQVVRPPDPLITFDAFGESALNFTLRFWSRLDVRIQVRSELNTQIATEFEKNGIAIPFPQRDVHLHVDQSEDRLELPIGKTRRAAAGTIES